MGLIQRQSNNTTDTAHVNGDVEGNVHSVHADDTSELIQAMMNYDSPSPSLVHQPSIQHAAKGQTRGKDEWSDSDEHVTNGYIESDDDNLPNAMNVQMIA